MGGRQGWLNPNWSSHSAEFVGVTAAAAIGGIAGAKLFHLLEYPEEFLASSKRRLNASAGSPSTEG